MGYGDELMVAGEAKRRGGATSKRFAVPDPRGGQWPPFRWSPVWDGNPRMAPPGTPYDEVIDNRPGHRPYIVAKSPTRWTWRAYAPEPAEYFIIGPYEQKIREQAKGKVIVNPQLKSLASPNKQWGIDRWQQLVRANPHIDWVQLGPAPTLQGVPLILTRTFREGCAAVAGARALVTHEGGLHHAAAALGIPAVVLFGGFISPASTGYAGQVNLFQMTEEHPLGCGMRLRCFHCEKAMASFTVKQVKKLLEELL